MRRQTLLAVGFAAVLLIAGCAGGTGTVEEPSTDRHIQVTGSGSASAAPNQAVVQLSVVGTGADAVTARGQLAENVTRMRTALGEIGINDSHITTERYDIDQRPRHRVPPDERADEPPYRAVHEFAVRLDNTDRVGTVIDTAVRNGATGVDDIEFGLATDERRALEADARRAAMRDAREKADDIAEPANLTVVGARTVATGRSGAPRPARDTGYATATEAAGPPTDVETGSVEVVVTVTVVYDVERSTG